MSISKVKEYLKQFGAQNRIIELEQSSATVELAAAALNCEGARIAKTLSFVTDNGVILIVCAGDTKIDNSKYKAEFSQKAKMVPFDSVEEMTGHAAGGVCPFGIKEGVKVYLDESLKRFKTVYPACGSSNSAIELNMEELEEYSGFDKWVNVTKDWAV